MGNLGKETECAAVNVLNKEPGMQQSENKGRQAAKNFDLKIWSPRPRQPGGEG